MILNSPWGIHWFRRDLRVLGNPALKLNYLKTTGKLFGVFIFDKTFLSRPDYSPRRFHFFLQTLISLREDLRSLGSDLYFFDEGPIPVLKKLGQLNFKYFTFNTDGEPYARNRDAGVTQLMNEMGKDVITAPDHLLISPSVLLKKDGTPYSVYTPFSKKWLEILATESIHRRIETEGVLKDFPNDKVFTHPGTLNDYQAESEKILQSYLQGVKHYGVPKAGRIAAHSQLQSFNPDSYEQRRNFPAENGGSGFSIFIKNGSLTISQIILHFRLHHQGGLTSGKLVFLKELIWREFYYHALIHEPRIEHHPCKPIYQNIPWSENATHFQRWCEGCTGFPLVDAGMRELLQTGRMHNRVRMVTASFLIKDLLINWQKGEQFFMQHLLDGDLAANNGGWQWAASTGHDSAPYFRIFNPFSQSSRFDSSGKYIKKWIPELSNVNAEDLHNPILNHPHYPPPMVDHNVQRLKAIAMYKQVLK